MVELPWRGMSQALIRARIPYLQVHADHIDRDAAQFLLADIAQPGANKQQQIATFVREYV